MTLKPTTEEALVTDIDEGFGDIEEMDVNYPDVSTDDAISALPPESDNEDEVSTTTPTIILVICELCSRLQNHKLKLRGKRNQLTPEEFQDGTK